VAVDGSGNVYVAHTGNNVVKEILAVNGSIPASPTIGTLMVL
jgi:DNA-binding beta-propeller fold protein YncE